jgi:hypothetical protein
MRTQARRRFRRFTRKDLFELFVCIALAGLFVLLSSGAAFGQGNVGINNPMPHAKSLLDLTSTDKGLLTPRMAAAQRTAMFPAPDATGKGMLVYQTDGAIGFYYYDGAAWQMLQAGGAGWGLLGNAGTNPATNFLGTTDNQGFALRTNNLERMRLDAAGNVGVGNTAPASKLHVTRGAAGYAPNGDAVITAENLGAAYVNVLSGNSESGVLFGSSNDPQNGGLLYNAGSVTNGFQIRTGGNASRMIITSSGDVTVANGVFWPGYKFGVVADQPSAMSVYHNQNANGYSGIHFINNASTARAHMGAGNTTSPNWANMGYTGTYTNHPFVLTTNDLERMRIDATGNVGIGTSTPYRLLELASVNQAVQRLTSNNAVNGSVIELNNTTTGNNGIGAINFLDNNSAIGQFIYHKADGMIFRTASAERVRIDVTGNVGIGTTAPASKLHVARAAAGFAPNANAAITAEGSGPTYMNVLSGSSESGVLFGASGMNQHGGLVYNAAATPNGLQVRTGGNVARMVVESDGDVGIGTNTPSTRLHVATDLAAGMAMTVQNLNPAGWSGTNYTSSTGAGNSAVGFDNATQNGFLGTTTNHPVTFISNWTERMRIAANGNVGIGTPAPGYRLDVQDAAQAVARLTSLNHANGSVVVLSNTTAGPNNLGALNFTDGATTWGQVGYHATNGMTLRTGNQDRMRIATDGKVGIGTTAPTSELEVNGFTKLGSNAPAIKQIEFTGTTAATEGNFVDIAHGLTASKIIDVHVLIEYTAGNWIPSGYTINPEYLADYVIGSTNIRLYNHNGSSGSILSKPVKVLVTYKA